MRPSDVLKASTGNEGRSKQCHDRCVFASTIGAIELTKEVRLVFWCSLGSGYGSCSVSDIF